MIITGKYFECCREVHLQLNAKAVLLIVRGGVHGDDFSAVYTTEEWAQMPAVLRMIADRIEEDFKKDNL